MKLLGVTARYGDRIILRPNYWDDAFYFTGRQPAAEQMLLLDLPGLPEATTKAIITWLTQQAGQPSASRREFNELPEKVWRPASLDDFLEASNYQVFTWQLYAHFSLAEFDAFMTRWLPEAQQRLHQALELPNGPARQDLLKRLQPFLERIFSVTFQTPRRVTLEHEALIREIELAQIAALRSTGFNAEKWLETAEKLYTQDLLLSLVYEVADHLAQPGTDPAHINAILARIHGSERLKYATANAQPFWQKLKHCARFDSNVQGETIDISTATEQTIPPGWAAYEARRVGRIIPGRAALVLAAETAGQPPTYIGADRKLKFQVARAGGRLEKFGNILTVEGGSVGLHQALLEVEMLDTLANVAPMQALARLESLHLPPDHPVFAAARAAGQDPRQARVLADLLIELAVGIDADIAHRLVRSQSSRRRRR